MSGCLRCDPEKARRYYMRLQLGLSTGSKKKPGKAAKLAAGGESAAAEALFRAQFHVLC